MPAAVDPRDETARTPRIALRPMRLDDVAAMHRLRERPEVMKYTPTGPATDVSQTEDWVRGCLSRSNCYNFSIELAQYQDRDRVIGVLGAARAPEVGYLLHPDFWGQGLATEALAAFLPLFWKKYDGVYDYATAEIDPDHEGSRRVLTKCGFVLWKTRKLDFHSPTMGLRDTHVYRLSRPSTYHAQKAEASRRWH